MFVLLLLKYYSWHYGLLLQLKFVRSPYMHIVVNLSSCKLRIRIVTFPNRTNFYISLYSESSMIISWKYLNPDFYYIHFIHRWCHRCNVRTVKIADARAQCAWTWRYQAHQMVMVILNFSFYSHFISREFWQVTARTSGVYYFYVAVSVSL